MLRGQQLLELMLLQDEPLLLRQQAEPCSADETEHNTVNTLFYKLKEVYTGHRKKKHTKKVYRLINQQMTEVFAYISVCVYLLR